MVRQKEKQRRRDILEYFGVDERMIKHYDDQREKVTKAFHKWKMSKMEWPVEQDKINEQEDKKYRNVKMQRTQKQLWKMKQEENVRKKKDVELWLTRHDIPRVRAYRHQDINQEFI